MTLEIGQYEFRGPFADTNNISDRHIGVYVILCMVNDQPHCTLDIGTSEGGSPHTSTGNLQARVENSGRKQCWKENVHGEIGYCVKHVNANDKRLSIEEELQWKYDPPCGTFPWEMGSTVWNKYDEFNERYGESGSYDI